MCANNSHGVWPSLYACSQSLIVFINCSVYSFISLSLIFLVLLHLLLLILLLIIIIIISFKKYRGERIQIEIIKSYSA